MATELQPGDTVECAYGRGVVQPKTPHTHRAYTVVHFPAQEGRKAHNRRVRTATLVKLDRKGK